MAINVRRWTRATPSNLILGSGSWDPFGVESLLDSDWSWAAILRFKQVGVEQVILCGNAGGNDQFSIHLNASDELCIFTDSFGLTSKSTFTVAQDVWYLLGIGADKDSTTQPNEMRFHKFEYGGAWTHENGDQQTFFGNNDALTFRIGDNASANGPTGAGDFECLIMGLSPNLLTDGNFETLEDDGTGGTFTDWLSLMGTVWRFNQALATTDVLDLDTFNADETSQSSTSVVSVTEPTGWGEDGGGAANKRRYTMPLLGAG